MKRFYYKFQWFGVALVALLCLPGVMLMGENPLSSIDQFLITILTLTALVTTAILTTRNTTLNKVKKLPKRLTLLLEPVYVIAGFIMLTSGNYTETGKLPPIVAILTSRDIELGTATHINTAIRTLLFVSLVVLAITATLTAFRLKLKNSVQRWNAERYNILYLPDNLATGDQESTDNVKSNDDNDVSAEGDAEKP